MTRARPLPCGPPTRPSVSIRRTSSGEQPVSSAARASARRAATRSNGFSARKTSLPWRPIANGTLPEARPTLTALGTIQCACTRSGPCSQREETVGRGAEPGAPPRYQQVVAPGVAPERDRSQQTAVDAAQPARLGAVGEGRVLDDLHAETPEVARDVLRLCDVHGV